MEECREETKNRREIHFMSFSCCYPGSEKENPKMKRHPVFCTHSFIFLFFLLFPTLGCCVDHIHQSIMCCGQCVYRLWMFPVLLQSAWRHGGEALRPAGIISSDEWRLKVLGWGLIVCVFSLSVKLILPSLNWNTNYFPSKGRDLH